MTDYDALDTYNGDTEHDIWVNFDNFENICNPNVFDDYIIDNSIDNLNAWD